MKTDDRSGSTPPSLGATSAPRSSRPQSLERHHASERCWQRIDNVKNVHRIVFSHFHYFHRAKPRQVRLVVLATSSSFSFPTALSLPPPCLLALYSLAPLLKMNLRIPHPKIANPFISFNHRHPAVQARVVRVAVPHHAVEEHAAAAWRFHFNATSAYQWYHTQS